MKMSTGVEAMKMPLRPPMTNMATNARALSIGTVKRIVPPQRVPSQLKVLIADGTAITMVVMRERHAQRRVHAALEHVVTPDDPGQEPDTDHGVHHGAIAEDRLA